MTSPEKSKYCQIRASGEAFDLLEKFTTARKQRMSAFLTDLLFVFEETLQKEAGKVEKFVGKAIYKKYFEER